MQSRHRSPAPQNCGTRRGPFWSWRSGCMLLLLLVAPFASFAAPQDEGEAASPPATATITVPIGYLEQEVKRPIPLSRLNVAPDDLGVAGASIALQDNNTTGRFTKQQFTLEIG